MKFIKMKFTNASSQILKRLYHDQQGAALVYFSLVITILLLFSGLAIDGSMAYLDRRQMQTAADAASIAGTRALALKQSATIVDSEIQAMASTNSADSALWQTINDNRGVRVAVSNMFEAAFAPLFGFDTITVGAAAATQCLPVADPPPILPPIIFDAGCINNTETTFDYNPGDNVCVPANQDLTLPLPGPLPAPNFANPGVVTFADPSGIDVGVPFSFPAGTISGNDIEQIQLYYDIPLDTLYVRIDTYGIAGDVDGDGDPGDTRPELAVSGGIDFPDFGGSESFALMLDIDEDGYFDVIAGVSAMTDINGFSVSQFAGSPYAPGVAFGTSLMAHTATLFTNPSEATPDLEFGIPNFSALPISSSCDNERSFGVTAFIGSFSDGGIGEDHAPGATNYFQVPPTVVTDGTNAPGSANTCTFSWLNWDGGSSSNTEIEAAFADFTQSGVAAYNAQIPAGAAAFDTLTLANSMTNLIGQPVIVSVFDPNNNTPDGFLIDGFAQLLITGFDLNSSPAWISGQFQPAVVPSQSVSPTIPDYGACDIVFVE